MKSQNSGRATESVFRAVVSVWGKAGRAGLVAALFVGVAIAGGSWLIAARGALARPGRPQVGGGSTPTYTFTTIAVPGQGKFALQGTLAITNNAGGDVAGVYIDNSYASHGFVRAASTGTISKFVAPNAGTVKNQGTFPIKIELAGNITGMYADSNNAYHGFLRAPDGTITQFDVTGAPTTIGHRGTIPLNINAALQITGFYVDANAVRHGFIRAADGTFTTFDIPGAGAGPTQGTIPAKINGAGAVAGFYVDANQVFHGFTRNAVKGTFVGPIDEPNASGGVGIGKGPSFTGTIVHSFDGFGGVGGIYTDASGMFHGFLFSANSVFTSVDVPGAGTTGIFRGTLLTNIDGFGDITGAYSDASGVEHGFAIAGGTTTINAPLDVPGASTTGLFAGTVPLSINGTGELAGAYADASGIFQGFIATASATATPSFSPAQGTYSSAQSVTITDATPNSLIFYTTDGTSPLTSATAIQYTGPIAVSSTETIEAVAGTSGFANSAVVTATYTINTTMSPAATPTFSPAAGTYTSAQTVTISDTTPGATIYYTLDGSTPTTGSTKYTGTISVGSTETIKAIAAATGFSNSAVATAAYTINTTVSPAATPTFSPAAGAYTSAQTVTISDTTPGATIFYTLDGSTPTTSSTKYTSTITVGSTETINAIAAAAGFSNSAVATATYTITLGDFQVSVSPSTLTIAAGQSGTATFTVTPLNGFNSSVNFACSGLPSEAACTFSPSSVTPNGKAATSTLTVTTTAPSAFMLRPMTFLQRPIYAIMLPVLALVFGIRARRKGSLSGVRLLCLIMLMGVFGLASCNSGSTSVKNPGTPLGTSLVSVSASTGGAAINHNATLTIIITK